MTNMPCLICSELASETYQTVLRDMREVNLKKKTRGLMMSIKLERFKTQAIERLDSDEEIEKEIKAKRKLTAQRHWAVIRRDVKDKIMQRKKNNTTDKSWIILRSQCLAKTGTNRQQLYERYGISSISTGKRHSIDKTSRPYSFHASRTHQGKSSRDGSKSAQVPRTSEKSCKSPRLCEEYLLPYNVQQIINRFHAWKVKSISRSADSYYDSINDQNDNSDS